MSSDNEAPQPFKISVSDETNSWLKERVRTARVIPDIQHPEGKEWAHGIPTSTVQDIVDYWNTSYDWRKVEARINATFKMFTVNIDQAGETINLHFVHHRSEQEGAVPLLFAHGWPGNFMEVYAYHLARSVRGSVVLRRSSTCSSSQAPSNPNNRHTMS